MVDAAPFTFAPLTATAFLDRSAAVFGDHIAVVDGDRRFSYTRSCTTDPAGWLER